MRRLRKAIDAPPIWLTVFIVLGWGAARLAPLGLVSPAPWLGGGVILGGVLLILWSGAVFAKARTPIHPRKTPQTLVRRGPFALSRNPIYLAMAVILIGWGVALGSLWPALFAPVFMYVIQKRFIEDEEATLAEAFPEEWADWTGKTRRWL